MNITIHACGITIDNGQSTQRGACAVDLHYADEYDRIATRTISEFISDSTNPQCDLKAAMFGLMSINADLRNKPIELFVSTYVAQLLERDNKIFKLIPKKNIELVRRLREKVDLFSDLTVKAGTKAQLQHVLNVAKITVETKVSEDTGTVVL